jgi:hypothetical protein
MQIFTLNPTDNTITVGVNIREYDVDSKKLIGIDVGIFNKPGSTTLKVFNIYDSKADETITKVAPIYKSVRYHADRKYLSAAKTAADEEVCDNVSAMVYFNADVPSSRANIFNTESLYNKGVFYAGRKLDDEIRTNKFGKEYVYESLPAVLIVDKDAEYKYATYIDSKKHIVTFKYTGEELVIVKDDILERLPRKPYTPRVDSMNNTLAESLRDAYDAWSANEANNGRSRKDNKFKKDKWESNHKESHWK